MQIDRLVGILSVLMETEKTTAPYLAERFEVSRRTISRDIDVLCQAGIPLVTLQGKNGGIFVEKGYKLDAKLLTGGELEAILTGLEGLDSVTEDASYRQLAEKLKPKNDRQASPFHIDLASFYKNSLAPKIKLLEQAIRQTRMARFYYYGPKKESGRRVEPYLLVFRWSAWYLWGYCVEKEAFRLFKLNRLWELKIEEVCYTPRPVEPLSPVDETFPSDVKLCALVSPRLKYRLIDEYGIHCFTECENGFLYFETDFYGEEELLQWVLGFGADMQVLSPATLKKKIKQEAKKLYALYKT